MSVYEDIKTGIEQAIDYETNKDDRLVITFDYCSPDFASLCVERTEKDMVRVLNIISGNEAIELYNKLRGIEAYERYNPRNIF